MTDSSVDWVDRSKVRRRGDSTSLPHAQVPSRGDGWWTSQSDQQSWGGDRHHQTWDGHSATDNADEDHDAPTEECLQWPGCGLPGHQWVFFFFYCHIPELSKTTHKKITISLSSKLRVLQFCQSHVCCNLHPDPLPPGDDASGSGSGMCTDDTCSRGPRLMAPVTDQPTLYHNPPENKRVLASANQNLPSATMYLLSLLLLLLLLRR